MNNELRKPLEPKIREQVIGYLKENNLFEELLEAGKLGVKKEDIIIGERDLDYDSISLRNYTIEKKDKTYSIDSIMWSLPFRIMDKFNSTTKNVPGKKIAGILNTVCFKIQFDEESEEFNVFDFQVSKRSSYVN